MLSELKGMILAQTRPWASRFPWAHVAFSALTLVYFLKFRASHGVDRPADGLHEVLSYGYSLLAVNVLVGLLGRVAHGPKLRHAVLGALFFTQWAGLSYHFRQRSPIEFSVLTQNSIADSLAFDSLVVAVNYISIEGLIWATVGTGVFLGCLRSFDQQERTRPGWAAVGLGVAYLAILIAPVTTWGPVTNLLRSAIRQYTEAPLFEFQAEDLEYPYERRHAPGAMQPLKRDGRPPHILLVLVESLNANFIEKLTEDGRAITPTFNAKLQEGLYVENFYGNSIQTCRGHAAVFLSVIPSMGAKIATSFADNRWYGAPALLEDNGYLSLFLQAHSNLEYDNGRQFYRATGFSQVRSIAEFPKAGDENGHWGWALSDRVFYQRFFEQMDQLRSSKPQAPLFAALAPISNHFPFDRMPASEKQMYPNAQSFAENYANSVNAADRALAQFFQALDQWPEKDNTVVILTGDHSFPVDEHGQHFNTTGYYEEYFRTPLLILWPGKVPPERRAHGDYSQLDIAPTLAQLAGISGYRHHFLGDSILDPSTGKGPVYLVQPYSGRYLAVVDQPYKFVKHLRSGREYLYNLRSDPHEQQDLAGQPQHQSIQDQYRAKLRAMYLNQELVQRDRVWSGATSRGTFDN
ncbi:MAG: hypothetical protein RJA70_2513 [Pseudomonadota bacterium]|jgi:hypothetical protein